MITSDPDFTPPDRARRSSALLAEIAENRRLRAEIVVLRHIVGQQAQQIAALVSLPAGRDVAAPVAAEGEANAS